MAHTRQTSGAPGIPHLPHSLNLHAYGTCSPASLVCHQPGWLLGTPQIVQSSVTRQKCITMICVCIHYRTHARPLSRENSPGPFAGEPHSQPAQCCITITKHSQGAVMIAQCLHKPALPHNTIQTQHKQTPHVSHTVQVLITSGTSPDTRSVTTPRAKKQAMHRMLPAPSTHP